MSQDNYQAVADALLGAERICVVTHLRPDADAIGSATALCIGMRQLGKEVRSIVGQHRALSDNLLTIPRAGNVRLADSLPTDYDLYVTVDCGSLARTGSVAQQLERKVAKGKVICIDHHASNEGFGTINLVDARCESTTSVLAKLFNLMNVQVDKQLAHCLYAGLVTDTGSFRWGRPEMHEFAGRLMQYGIDTKQIAVDLMDSTTADDLQMTGRVLAGLQLVSAGKYTMAVLTGHFTDIGGHSESAVESLVDFVRALRGTDMGVVFKEQSPGHWAVSLRSSTLNCADLAISLGGGGHIPAAGYSTSGTAEEILDEITEAVAQL
ncbi:DHH family phosphoesterase [Corynebacterium endometrii]|uniref:Bifunctional oligoribonuclease and PAP phosphatase NrnA n=1 Tax=Corynebacterium endometrii TaxID=2488819 RepID=A0A4P7QFZ1_9CORY|nr:bifunctional oligoribonuclease/PAP phosphatase NrnA [Corynebacterium endometrii]QCB28671.1 Bifunctional oligoribonuclease and PAP phosphatase NrnA [Corynebacterium endometrii]